MVFYIVGLGYYCRHFGTLYAFSYYYCTLVMSLIKTRCFNCYLQSSSVVKYKKISGHLNKYTNHLKGVGMVDQ